MLVAGAAPRTASGAEDRKRIVIDPKTPPILHDWYVHGAGLQFKDTNTRAVSFAHAGLGCLDPTGVNQDWCNDILEFDVTNLGSSVKLTVTRSYVRDEQTHQEGPAVEPVPVGGYFILKPFKSDYLITTRYNPDGSKWLSNWGGNNLGNPYLCKPNTTDPDHLCGA